MSIDPTVVGTSLETVTALVERSRLKFFAKAVGETNRVYFDLDAARAAGHRDLPVPPTFFFSLDQERPDPMEWLTSLGVDMGHVLHGEQSFRYHQMAHAGDSLTIEAHIGDVWTKKGGALQFIRRDIAVTRGDESIATMTSVIVVRDPDAGRS